VVIFKFNFLNYIIRLFQFFNYIAESPKRGVGQSPVEDPVQLTGILNIKIYLKTFIYRNEKCMSSFRSENVFFPVVFDFLAEIPKLQLPCKLSV